MTSPTSRAEEARLESEMGVRYPAAFLDGYQAAQADAEVSVAAAKKCAFQAQEMAKEIAEQLDAARAELLGEMKAHSDECDMHSETNRLLVEKLAAAEGKASDCERAYDICLSERDQARDEMKHWKNEAVNLARLNETNRDCSDRYRVALDEILDNARKALLGGVDKK